MIIRQVSPTSDGYMKSLSYTRPFASPMRIAGVILSSPQSTQLW